MTSRNHPTGWNVLNLFALLFLSGAAVVWLGLRALAAGIFRGRRRA